ncbi:MAG: hypothetical protein HKN16_00460 [Saprospiraceae bacterium]|nr:hypothetical protein [Saprospiraceae bacterium]
MKLVFRLFLLAGGFAFLASTSSLAQCGKFTDTAKESEALEAHVLYRDQVKLGNLDGAYENWKKAYELAPAADGKRASHYQDGRQIMIHKMASASGAEKEEMMATVMRLYEEELTCYGKDGASASIKAYQGFDMFYELESPYLEVEKVLKSSVSEAGNKAEYFIFLPYAYVVVDLFNEGNMSKEDARWVYKTLNDAADYQVANGSDLAEDYKQAKIDVAEVFEAIEDGIFDCDYFKNKLIPEYQAAPNDSEVIQRVYNKLVQSGCDQGSADMQEMKGKFENMMAAENARRQAEYEKNNPASVARRFYENGDYSGAIGKYEEALAKSTDPAEKAEIYMGMASIQGRNLGSPGKGRQLALKAADLKPNWGKPYMLIGDLYAKGARSCGDAFNQRLAILAAVDKYAYAKSIDPNVASDANKRMSSYRSSRPDKETAFMMGHKEGSRIKVGCWIGETVVLRF